MRSSVLDHQQPLRPEPRCLSESVQESVRQKLHLRLLRERVAQHAHARTGRRFLLSGAVKSVEQRIFVGKRPQRAQRVAFPSVGCAGVSRSAEVWEGKQQRRTGTPRELVEHGAGLVATGFARRASFGTLSQLESSRCLFSPCFRRVRTRSSAVGFPRAPAVGVKQHERAARPGLPRGGRRQRALTSRCAAPARRRLLEQRRISCVRFGRSERIAWAPPSDCRAQPAAIAQRTPAPRRISVPTLPSCRCRQLQHRGRRHKTQLLPDCRCQPCPAAAADPLSCPARPS